MPCSNICRLCLFQTPITFPLMKNNCHKMLEALTSIKLNINDEILTICLKCTLNLKLAYGIQQSILKADEKLKNGFLNNVKIKDGIAVEKTNEINVSDKETVKIGSEKEHIAKVHSNHPSSVEVTELKEQISVRKKRKPQKSPTDKLNALQKKELAMQLVSLSEFRTVYKKKPPKKDHCSPYTCNICLKKFVDKGHFHSHNHRRKPCPICKKEITVDNFSKHVKTHTSGPQMCEQCGKTYINIESLRGHIFYKHRGKHYECRECKITFKNRQGLNGHRKKQHNIGTNHICETCGRKFFFSYDLKKHIQGTHLKLRPYVCEFCKKSFSGLHAMKTHRRQHTNETPYRCEVCGDGFRQNVSLRAHRKSKHNIIEAVTCACKICGKGFSSMHAVKAHMRCH